MIGIAVATSERLFLHEVHSVNFVRKVILYYVAWNEGRYILLSNG